MSDRFRNYGKHHEAYQKSIREEISHHLEQTFSAHDSQLWLALRELVTRSLSGGKGLRATCAFLGFQLAQEDEVAPAPENLVALGAALETYQASALTHDDYIDHSELRRGNPSVPALAHQLANRLGLAPSAQEYVSAAATFVGDLTLGMAFEFLGNAVQGLEESASLLSTFATMTSRVAIGQYLDTTLDFTSADSLSPAKALEVISYKTAGYSVITPVCLGAILGGMPSEDVRQLEAALAPWGFGFQLRDDQLGAFGISKETGKPTASDLKNGKRTVLMARTLEILEQEDPQAKAELVELLAPRRSRTEQDIARMAELLAEVSSQELLEKEIATLAEEGEAALDRLDFISPEALAQLKSLGQSLLWRRV
ncbi:hypothetical protein BSR29_08310 [Boudabousia liubingyangii]|uniref:Polyprenyl synthetase family protein n=1 Tax=Boudabousia liubingyangii TaxID=1921764 RepID=A0A1Q5PJC0_9ACTO|nr:polyprenyl synthetase family protein [Boudabousia liubingyangii]OKL45974.1 hypothetical protein BSR29_08310 [Boudabousia liubingyangii]OKL47749.1 hypothetical protein BSR28_04515 [Boudabousia liubingyangii]